MMEKLFRRKQKVEKQDAKDIESLVIPEIPQGHAQVSMNEKDKCPYFQFQKNIDGEKELKDKNDKKQKKQKKPQGGCPFMTSEKKRNPPLEHLTDSYNQEYISPFNYLLDYKGIPTQERKFVFRKFKNSIHHKSRQEFERYPIYLKHTLFHENMEKVRNMQVSQRFFVYDQLREKGNKYYFKGIKLCHFYRQGMYQEAILYYEKALSCFRWLELIDEDELEQKKQIQEESKLESKEDQALEDFDQQSQQSEFSTNSGNADDIRSDVAIDDDEDHFERELENLKEMQQELQKEQKIKRIMQENSEKQADQIEIVLDQESKNQKDISERLRAEQILQQEELDKQFKKKYQIYLTTYNDENVRYIDQQDDKDATEKDLRMSMLLTLYLNIACAYLKLSHFKVARQALQQAQEVSGATSQILFRKVQSYLHDKNSSLEDLISVKKDLQAIEYLKPNEKIYKSEPMVLKLMNIENHNTIFQDQAKLLIEKIQNTTKEYTDRISELLERSAEIEEIYQEMVSKGTIPSDCPQSAEYNDIIKYQTDDTKMSIEIVEIMINKYYDILDYYLEIKNDSQVEIAKQELQNIMEVYNKIMFYYKLDFKQVQNPNFAINTCIQEANKEFQIDFTNERARLQKLLYEKVREIYENADFNFQLFEYALKLFYDEKREREKKIEQKNQQNDRDLQKKPRSSQTFTIFSSEFLVQSLLLLILILVGLGAYKNSAFIQKMILNQKL